MSTLMIDEILPTKDVYYKTADFLDEIKAHGIMAQPYVRPPLGDAVLCIGMDAASEVFMVWPGTATLTIVDKALMPSPQIVLRAQEGDHTLSFKKTVSLKWSKDNHPWKNRLSEALNKLDQDSFDSLSKAKRLNLFNLAAQLTGTRNIVNVTLPPNTKFSDDFANSTLEVNFAKKKIMWTHAVTAQVPTFDNYFLIGYDEVKCFISQLPRPVTSVQDAHAALRPEGLVKGAVRQGEWFFNPCSKAEKQIINESRNRRTKTPLERNSTHSAEETVEINGVMYARGEIHDSRSLRHQKMILDDWHRVIRNLEVNVQENRQENARPARWD